jgi:ABC-type antimicrobial peptide transport system permease subunit
MTIRNFISNPSINLINLTGLTISLALVIVLSVYCYSGFTTDHFHKNADQIFLYPRTEEYINTTALLKEQIDLSVPSIDLTVRVGNNWEPSTFQVEGHEPFNSDLFFADNEFFDMFNYNPIVGNLGDALKNPMTLVVTKSFAKKLFGNIDVIGKTVKFNDSQLFTIEAVIEPPHENSVFSFDAITSVATKQIVYPNQEEYTNWGWTTFLTFIRVKEGVKPESVLKNIASALPENAKNLGYNSMQLIPLKKLYFSSYKYSFLHFGNKKQVMTFALAGMLILIIALVNYINISTSNWEEKIRQTGVRKVIGAKRTTIFLSLLSESFLFFIAAFLIASFLAFILSAVLTNYTGIHFNQNLFLTGKLLYFLVGSTLLVSVLFSLLPAIRISSSNATDNLKNKLNTRNKKTYTRAFMVTGQFIIAIVLNAFTII